MMKYYPFLLIAVLLISGCVKDPVYNGPGDGATGTFSMNIDTRVRDQFFTLNKDYYDVNGYRYQLNDFMYYVSHLSLIKQDGTLQEVKDVALVDYDGAGIGTIQTISGKVPPGTYTGVRFWLGVDSTLNNSDPSPYPNGHPLQNSDMHWDWAQGYRFVRLDGRCDSVVNDTSNIPSVNGMTYHPGTNALYTEVPMPARNIDILANATYNYDVKLDVNKIFYSATDTIIMYQDRATHTLGNFPLAQRIISHMSGAFTELQ